MTDVDDSGAPYDQAGWEPTVEHRSDVVSETSAGALHDLLEREGARPTNGVSLPPLWHWLAFLPQARHGELGQDGHPRTGSHLPPTHGKARMHAGGRVARQGNICVGQALTRRSAVRQVETKLGRSGELLLVTVDQRISPEERNQGRIFEEQDLVYREAQRYAAPLPSPGTPKADASTEADWSWARDVQIESTLLFRFSALTYNAHRIHYDRDYAVHREGYPGLVVQGPLQAILLADAVERTHPHKFVSRFSFRAVAPAFDDHPLTIRLASGHAEGGSADVVVHAFSGGRHTMSAEVTFRADSEVVARD